MHRSVQLPAASGLGILAAIAVGATVWSVAGSPTLVDGRPVVGGVAAALTSLCTVIGLALLGIAVHRRLLLFASPVRPALVTAAVGAALYPAVTFGWSPSHLPQDAPLPFILAAGTVMAFVPGITVAVALGGLTAAVRTAATPRPTSEFGIT